MKREIKFRAKDIKTNEWVYGWYVSGNYIPKLLNYEHGCIMHFGRLQGALKKVEVDPATVGQYTGLKDKNGVEIYEGDIVNSDAEEKPHQVEWDNELAGFYPFAAQIPIAADSYSEWTVGETEVIGNIYENLELLK